MDRLQHHCYIVTSCDVSKLGMYSKQLGKIVFLHMNLECTYVYIHYSVHIRLFMTIGDVWVTIYSALGSFYEDNTVIATPSDSHSLVIIRNFAIARFAKTATSCNMPSHLLVDVSTPIMVR